MQVSACCYGRTTPSKIYTSNSYYLSYSSVMSTDPSSITVTSEGIRFIEEGSYSITMSLAISNSDANTIINPVICVKDTFGTMGWNIGGMSEEGTNIAKFTRIITIPDRIHGNTYNYGCNVISLSEFLKISYSSILIRRIK